MRSPIQATATTLTFILATLASAQQFYGGLTVVTTHAVTCTRHTKAGDVLSMHYRGTLASNGEEFDSSRNRGPFTFELGAGQVIKGWDVGLVGMCIGEQRNLTIPPGMAYGDRGVGGIPGGATLVFETELLGIKGVEKEEEVKADVETNQEVPENKPGPGESKTGGKGQPHATTSGSGSGSGSPKGPQDDDDGECKLLGPFALLIQGALGILAVSSLVWKRYRERPRRPLKVWTFDVSKQVLGSAMLHLLNLLMSMFSSGDFDIMQAASADATAASTSSATAESTFVQDAGVREKPNPCSFYLLNLAIDTTVGILVLVLLLRVLHQLFSLTPLARPAGSLRSGNYGHPPHTSWWLKQSLIYFLGLLGMKLCVFALFQLLPWLGWVGDWALRWTEGKAWVQITFVMLVFPLVMNAVQYWIIDGFIKDPVQEEDQSVQNDAESDEHEGLIGGNRRDSEEEGQPRLKEANPTPLPVEYDSEEDGEGAETRVGSSSSRLSKGVDARP